MHTHTHKAHKNLQTKDIHIGTLRHKLLRIDTETYKSVNMTLCKKRRKDFQIMHASTVLLISLARGKYSSRHAKKCTYWKLSHCKICDTTYNTWHNYGTRCASQNRFFQKKKKKPKPENNTAGSYSEQMKGLCWVPKETSSRGNVSKRKSIQCFFFVFFPHLCCLRHIATTVTS